MDKVHEEILKLAVQRGQITRDQMSGPDPLRVLIERGQLSESTVESLVGKQNS